VCIKSQLKLIQTVISHDKNFQTNIVSMFQWIYRKYAINSVHRAHSLELELEVTGGQGIRAQASGVAKKAKKPSSPVLQTKHKHTFKLHEIGQFGQFKIIKIVATRPYFKAKMHQIRFQLRLRLRHRCRSSQRFPDPLAGF